MKDYERKKRVRDGGMEERPGRTRGDERRD